MSKEYKDLTNEEKITHHKIIIGYLDDELKTLWEWYEEEQNITRRYERLIEIRHLEGLIEVEKDVLCNVFDTIKRRTQDD